MSKRDDLIAYLAYSNRRDITFGQQADFILELLAKPEPSRMPWDISRDEYAKREEQR